MPNVSVFFSWQADTQTNSGRNFIEAAILKTIRKLSADLTLHVAVREGIGLDKDTKGVSGSPPIVDTIFTKIDNAAIFVPDLTFVASRLDNRPAPNPNVLIEYGWALKSIGHAHIIPVMNRAYGEPTAESMPFDITFKKSNLV